MELCILKKLFLIAIKKIFYTISFLRHLVYTNYYSHIHIYKYSIFIFISIKFNNNIIINLFFVKLNGSQRATRKRINFNSFLDSDTTF